MGKNCIICRNNKDKFTLEHVIPAAIGGVFGILNVCEDCNRILGKNIDEPLAQHDVILVWRNIHCIKRDSRGIRNPFTGKHKGEDGNDYRVEFNEKGEPKAKVIPNAEKLTPFEDGFLGKFTYSPEDYPTIEEAKKAYAKRNNIDDPSMLEIKDTTFNPNPALQVNIIAANKPVVLGAIKIAYEFTATFIPKYLNDPIGKIIAEVLLTKEYSGKEYIFDVDEEALIAAKETILSVKVLNSNHHLVNTPKFIICILHIMTIKELNKTRVLIVSINPKLEKYKDVVLFQDKLDDANAFLKRAGLPGDEAKRNGHPVKLRKRVVRHTLRKKTTRRAASKV